MNAIRSTLCVAIIATLAACQGRAPEPASTTSSSSLARTISEAARKIDDENITIRTEDGASRKAEITPSGDLIVDGKPVTLDESQRRLLLDYRARVSDIAQAGAAVGAAGAELAGKAVTEAIGGIFSGKSDEVGQRVEAQAQGIKAAARKLCDQVPALQEAQRRAAAAIPEFAPFAKDKPHDAAKCHAEFDSETDPPSPPAPPAAPPAPAPTA